MKDKDKTKEQLIKGPGEMHQQTAKREASKTKGIENLVEILANNLTTGIYIVQDGKFRFVNFTFQKYVGYSEEELLGMDSLSLVYPEDRDMVRQNAVKMLKGERASSYEFRYVTKGGETLWVVESVASIQYQGRQATLATFMDISNRIWAQERHRQLADDINDGYAVVQEGKNVFVNKKFAEILGGELGLGESFTQFLAPDTSQVAMENYERVMRGEKAIAERYEAVGLKGDGTTFIVELGAKFIQYEGKPAICAIFRDITERKRAEEKLKVFSNAIEGAIDAIAIAMAITNTKGIITCGESIITYTNSTMERMYGYKKEEMLGKSIRNLFPPNPEMENEMMSTIMKIGSWHGELESIRKNKEIFPILLSLSVIDEKGNIIAMMGTIRDITERKRAEEKLQELYK
ncbi:MAG TPA: PAS domain S-box protein, partial [Dehalococcoidia bacterium]|nr:PAS domain S-box protein [Dehalococcoidia bacterium]